MKSDHPVSYLVDRSRWYKIHFFNRSIQNKPNLGNLTLSEAFLRIVVNFILTNQAKNIKLTKALSGISC